MRKISFLLGLSAVFASANLAGAAQVDIIEGEAPAGAPVVEIDIKKQKYVPATMEIAPGTIIKWTNHDAIPHNVKLPAPIEVTGKMLRAGQSFEMRFNEAGEYSYVCGPHPYMKGQIIVKP
ncbi:MAG TPA: cupredoxin family copper-binding protein [Hyphomicrobium sp.]|nr:cupredoxin family copper-binding protein [Hyphomicrobium sp.]